MINARIFSHRLHDGRALSGRWLSAAVLSAATFAFAACAGPSEAKDGAWLERTVGSAKSGAVIDVPAGDYNITDLKIRRDLTLRGAADGDTVFLSAAVTEKGLLVPLTGVSLTVENIVFRDAVSWDRNGAGIRHEGRDLTIINCIFDGNEDGVLATGDNDGAITIRNSQFIGNGFGDGQSHGVYVSSGASLDIAESRFVGSRIGHHVKSLAVETRIVNSYFDDADGRSSYALDASRGGRVVFSGNTVIQTADAENYSIINYDLTRGGEALGVTVTNNKIINRFNGGVLLRNDTPRAPVLAGNEIVNEGARPLRLVSRGSPAPVSPD